MKNKILVIAPWVGEFAFEVFFWQGYMRKKSKDYNKVICYGLIKNKYLYEDFCDEYIDFPHNRSLSCMSVNRNGIEDSDAYTSIIKKYSDNDLYDLIIPKRDWDELAYEKHLKPYVEGDQIFIPLGKYEKSLEYDIVFHMRNLNKDCHRNWSFSNWDKLIQLLLGKYDETTLEPLNQDSYKNLGFSSWHDLIKHFSNPNYKIACIGSSNDYYIEGADDFRNIDLEKESNLLRSSKLLAGAGSGGVHFGMLCGVTSVVWLNENYREFVEKNFNPLNNKCIFIPNKNPSLEDVYITIIKNIKK
jgi:hypothetical protein